MRTTHLLLFYTVNNGVFTLSDTENDTCTDTDADNMRNISHCSNTESGNDADNMQNSLFTCPK